MKIIAVKTDKWGMTHYQMTDSYNRGAGWSTGKGGTCVCVYDNGKYYLQEFHIDFYPNENNTFEDELDKLCKLALLSE